jgi:hypothetical protein
MFSLNVPEAKHILENSSSSSYVIGRGSGGWHDV